MKDVSQRDAICEYIWFKYCTDYETTTDTGSNYI